MRFPIVIHKDETSAYGVTVPDLPGCFSAGDTPEDAIVSAQEAIEWSHRRVAYGWGVSSLIKNHARTSG